MSSCALSLPAHASVVGGGVVAAGHLSNGSLCILLAGAEWLCCVLDLPALLPEEGAGERGHGRRIRICNLLS